MSLPLHNYPYTDFHEINLDYILKSIKELNEDVSGLKLKIDNQYIYLLDKAGNELSKILYPDNNGIYTFKAFTYDDDNIWNLEVDESINVDTNITPDMYQQLPSIFNSGKAIFQEEHHSTDFGSVSINLVGFLQIANSSYPIISVLNAYSGDWYTFQISYNNITDKLNIKRLY